MNNIFIFIFNKMSDNLIIYKNNNNPHLGDNVTKSNPLILNWIDGIIES